MQRLKHCIVSTKFLTRFGFWLEQKRDVSLFRYITERVMLDLSGRKGFHGREKN